LINPFRTGKIVMFQVTYNHEWRFFEIICFFLIGAFGGLFGALFIKCNIWWAKIRATKLKNYPVHEVLALVMITSIVSYWNIFTRMGSGELVTNLFKECQDEHQGDLEGLCVNEPEQFGPVVGMLLYAMLIKIVLTIFTFGCRVPCGIFIPSMVVGASFGRIVGLGVQYLQLVYPDLPVFSSCTDAANCINPGVYAIIGAAAGLGGVTRMTVSLIVIMFELTGSLTYVLPLMISILVAKWTGDALVPGSIYDWLIEANGHPYLDSKTEYIHLGQTNDITEHDLQVIDVNESNTVSDLRKKLAKMANHGYPDGGFPVLNGQLLIGYIACNELEHALDTLNPDDVNAHCYFSKTFDGYEDHLVDLTAYMDQAPLTISENSSMELVLELFSKLGVRYVCVVSHGQYVGMIHKKRLLAYLKEYEQQHH
ncbi:Clc chloride channel, partial [Basidiobolus meristosporus CBS 931.73]